LKTLDVQARLEYARAAVAVLRGLAAADNTLRHHQFATAIGLIADGEGWRPWHRQQVGDILKLVGAVETQAGEKAGTLPLQFQRIVDQHGQPGTGFYKKCKIICA
jgi:hypothetical protein